MPLRYVLVFPLANRDLNTCTVQIVVLLQSSTSIKTKVRSGFNTVK